MSTFQDYMNEQNLHNKLIETATLMVEKNVEPIDFLQKWYEQNHPELFVILNEGLWDNIKQAGSQMWQGIKQGGQQFAANQFGPQSKFNAAIKSLTDLVTYMKNDPQLSSMRGETGRIMNQINGINKQLARLRDYIPQMQTQTTSQWQQPNAPSSTIPMPTAAPTAAPAFGGGSVA